MVYMEGLKIFCISYPRTGTTSLIQALKGLGYGKAWHYEHAYYKETLHAIKTGEFSNRILSANVAFADIPIPIIYKNLDIIYPDSKFILITREKQSWFESMTWVLKAANKKHAKKNECNNILWSDIYPEMIDEHTRDVTEYFAGSNRLLIKGLKLYYQILN